MEGKDWPALAWGPLVHWPGIQELKAAWLASLDTWEMMAT